MQLRSLLVLGAVGGAAYIPGENWSLLTPPSPNPAGATTDYATKFGICIETLKTSAAPLKASPTGGVNQIKDGQIQNQQSQQAQKVSIPAVNQTSNSQIQQPGSKPKTSAPIAAPVNQINDGQIQNQASAKKGSAPTAPAVNQIGDGQIQNQGSASKAKQGSAKPGSAPTASPVNQNGVGQNQDHNSITKTTVQTTVNQISDGQIQNQSAKSVASKIEGKPQKNGNTSYSGQFPSVCSAEGNLEMTLEKSALIDSFKRIGYVADNGQIQFDSPPQSGALYAIGWAISKGGYLSFGNQEVLYQCLSGDFYNLYIKSLGPHCEEVKARVVHFTMCN
ncbi:hypothetical protein METBISCDRAFT_21907 [Metschnikowia bicuspidata]|uniref:Cell wall mannoprotein PIR1-like C-terminal domain-containing protein n=1 Tax=Metschnikowia bicuspidata TaxID=27322 RepID=A0A4P9ZI51_9ASCO|nr:hypothetical protein METBISCDRAFT_21907 [Metschnikowia bicuspidata]